MNKRLIQYFLVVVLTLTLLPIPIFAKEKIILKTDKTDLEVGDELVVTAELKTDMKVYAFLATLNYDESVFEKMTSDSFTAIQDALDVSYNATTDKFGFINKKGELSGKLFQVHLKVKEDANVGNTNIGLTNISASDGKKKTTFDKVSKEVFVTRNAKEGEVVPNHEIHEVKDQKEFRISTFTTKPFLAGLFLCILVLLCFAIYLRTCQKQKKKLWIGLICGVALLSIVFLIFFFMNYNKKDVNKDGEKTYEDAKEILEYLIDIEGTKEEENQNIIVGQTQNQTSTSSLKNSYTTLENEKNSIQPNRPSHTPGTDFDYDVNNDGEVDIEDVGGVAGETTENTNYQVQLKEKENESAYLVEQNGKATLQLIGTVTHEETIQKIKINGQYYAVTQNGTTYSVTVDLLNQPGVYTFEITSVVLSNGREIDTKLKLQKEVLKQAPKVDLFQIDNEEKTLDFQLEDPDKAFIKGQIVILDEEGREVFKEKISRKNHFQHSFEEDVLYTIIVTASYDLDTDTLNDITGQQNYNEDVEIYRHTFHVASNYMFTVHDFTLTSTLEKEEVPTLTFKSTNLKNLKVEYVVIDGKEYDVTLNREDYYEVQLKGLDTSKVGKYQLIVEKIVLENLKEFQLEKDYTMDSFSYTVLKQAPILEKIVLQDQPKEKSIVASYILKDEDSTLEHLTAVLVDSTEKIVDTKEEIEVGKTVSLSYQESGDGRYKVKFLATYNLGTDRHTYTDKNIGEKEILTQVEIAIQEGVVTTVYPVKNQKKYEITYTLSVSESFMKSHNYNKLSSITINGLNYDANQKTGFTSSISFTVPSESGVLNLEATRVQLQYEDYNHNRREFFSVKPYTIQIDVLKDQPKIEAFQIVNEDYEKQSATFSFTVSDDKGGFTSGEVEYNGQKEMIKRGKNTVTFNHLPKNENHMLQFYGDYDLDTNTLKEQAKEQNQYQHTLLHEIPYGLYDPDVYQQITLTHLEAFSKKQNTFFEKEEEIPLTFQMEAPQLDSNLSLEKILIGKTEYSVQRKGNDYQVNLKGYSTKGEKTISIQKIILSNGKTVTLTNPVSYKIEVLKTPIQMEDFQYQVEEKEILVHFAIKDEDQSVENLKEQVKIKILDEQNQVLLEMPYQDEIKLEKQDNLLRYYVQVIASYDRDSNKENEQNQEEKVLLEDVISLDQNFIELKEIVDITLYQNTFENTVVMDQVNVQELQKHLEDYFVKITMQKMPTVYSKIKKVITASDQLVLLLEEQYVVQEQAKDKTNLRINFGKIYNGIAKNEMHPETFIELIERMKKNPAGNFVLTHDLDANEVSNEDLSVVNIEFTGTFDGQGHQIKNLKKPFFSSLNGATVKNVRFTTVRLSGNNAHGTLANQANQSVIQNVFIEDYTNSSAVTESGTLLGRASHSTIEECKATNFNLNTVWLAQSVGGLVGYVENSILQNNYLIGNLSASWNFVGGFVGNVQGTSTLQNNYTKITLSNSSATISCGFACTSANTTVLNNISLSQFSGNVTHKFISSYKESKNNYFLAKEGDSFSQTGVMNLSSEQVDEALYQKAKFSETIWNLKKASYALPPTFIVEKIHSVKADESQDLYDENKEILYQNLIRLMPFYSGDKILESAKNIGEDQPISQQEILHILPIDASGKLVTYLLSDAPNRIAKIRLIFKNKETLEYSLRYDRTYDMVASYRIEDLKIDYTFNHYIIHSESHLVDQITNYLEGLTYEDNLDPLTKTDDSRLYRDHYNEVTKKNLREFALQLISNSNYTSTTNQEGIDNYLEKELKKDQKLEKILYVYNYLSRFYSVDFSGIQLNDLLLFASQGFHEKMNPYEIALSFLSDEKNLQLNQTNATYERCFAKYTSLKNIPELLEYYVTTLTDLEVDRWVTEQFKGYLSEQSVDLNQDIHYTLWDHLKDQDNNYNSNWYNYALPILTLPKDAAYIISTPTQFIIGAQRTYTPDPNDPEEQKKLQARIESYASRMKEYYTTAYKLVGDVKYLNDINTIQIDKRYTFDSNGNTVFQNPYTTEEPFHKNFNEVIGQWAYNDYNAATANGLYIIWRVEGLLDGNLEQGSEYTYHTWSHETAHNMDARLFLKNQGRRFDAGGEDYADSNLTQSFGDGDIVMNLSRHLTGTTSNISANLEPERIDTPAKIQDFYQKVFETIYIMDYLEGKAFLALSPLEQSKIAVQASYPNEGKYTDEENHLNYKYTLYQEIPESAYQNMTLNTIEDLYENHLVIFPGVIYSTYTDNRYGGENIYKAHWYQPHNDFGRPDSYSIKWLAYEMLGYKGYNDGYIEYYSNIHSIENGKYKNYKTDLMALQTITGDKTMTFEKYKKMRFAEVEKNLANIQIIQVNQVFQEFYEALKKDAQFVIEQEKLAWEKYKGDSDAEKNARNKIIAAAKQFKESTAVRRKIYYALKNGTNEFTGLVYNPKNPQTVMELKPFTNEIMETLFEEVDATVIEVEAPILEKETSQEEVLESKEIDASQEEMPEEEPSIVESESEITPDLEEQLDPEKKEEQTGKEPSTPENETPPVPEVLQEITPVKKKEEKTSIDDTPEK